MMEVLNVPACTQGLAHLAWDFFIVWGGGMVMGFLLALGLYRKIH